MKYFLFPLLLLSIQMFCQPQTSVINTVFAEINLAGDPFNETVTNSASGVSGSSSNSCMEAFGASYPDGTLKVKTSTSECELVNSPAASSSWKVDFRLGGNNGIDIPLTFNFGITSSTNIVSMASPGCLSIASAKFSGSAYSTNSDQGFSSHIIYQKGLVYLYNEENFDESEIRASLGLGIALGTDNIQIQKLSDSDLLDFLNKYNNLDPADQTLSANVINSLSSQFPVSSLELYSGEIRQSSAVILNLLNAFGILDRLSIDLGGGVEVGLTATVGMNYDFSRSIEVTTHDYGFIAGGLFALSKSSPCGGTSASVDASNSFILKSITIPNTFDHPDINEEDLIVEWNGMDFPVIRESDVSFVKDIYNTIPLVNVYPNPANDFLQVRSVNDLPFSRITLYGIDGSMLSDNRFTEKKFIKEFTLPIGHYEGGIYALRVVTPNGTIKKMIIIE